MGPSGPSVEWVGDCLAARASSSESRSDKGGCGVKWRGLSWFGTRRGARGLGRWRGGSLDVRGSEASCCCCGGGGGGGEREVRFEAPVAIDGRSHAALASVSSFGEESPGAEAFGAGGDRGGVVGGGRGGWRDDGGAGGGVAGERDVQGGESGGAGCAWDADIFRDSAGACGQVFPGAESPRLGRHVLADGLG